MAKLINLTVHGIGNTVRDLDPGESDTWVSVGQFERVLDAIVDRPEVRITFDDGNASDLEIALPRLLERGLKAEFFVLAGLLGQEGRLTVTGVKTLVESGMHVGSHGWAHRDWRKLTPAEEQEEHVRTAEVLADLTGSPISRVAIPYGSYDRHVLRRLRMAGIGRVYTSDGGPTRPDAWLQPRTSLRHDLDTPWITSVLTSPTLPVRARKLAGRTLKRTRG